MIRSTCNKFVTSIHAADTSKALECPVPLSEEYYTEAWVLVVERRIKERNAIGAC